MNSRFVSESMIKSVAQRGHFSFLFFVFVFFSLNLIVWCCVSVTGLFSSSNPLYRFYTFWPCNEALFFVLIAKNSFFCFSAACCNHYFWRKKAHETVRSTLIKASKQRIKHGNKQMEPQKVTFLFELFLKLI